MKDSNRQKLRDAIDSFGVGRRVRTRIMREIGITFRDEISELHHMSETIRGRMFKGQRDLHAREMAEIKTKYANYQLVEIDMNRLAVSFNKPREMVAVGRLYDQYEDRANREILYPPDGGIRFELKFKPGR